MRNQFFEPGFLFDLYGDRGSTVTLSVRSNVSWCGLRKFRSKPTTCRFCVFFPMFDHPLQKIRKRRETIFGSLVVGWVVY